MDSLELQYLKAMHEKNKKFYAHAVLALADITAMVAVLTETVKADIVLRNNYDLEGFQAELRKKQLEFQTGLRNTAMQSLRQEGLDTDPETN